MTRFSKEEGYKRAWNVDALINETLNAFDPTDQSNAIGYLAFLRTIETTIAIAGTVASAAIEEYKKGPKP